jgi:transcription elongation factor Elf1
MINPRVEGNRTVDVSDTTTRCQQCGAPATVRRNPYVGVDLSVHEFYVDCGSCGMVAFIPAERPPAAIPARRPGFFARLFGRRR